MARAFDDGSNQYLRNANAVITGTPATFACWFNTNDDTINQALMSISNQSDTWALLAIRGDYAGNNISAEIRENAVYEKALSSTGFTANTWYHACGVFVSNLERHAFLNGGGKGSDVDDADLLTPDQTLIGLKYVTSAPMSGLIAEAAIWNAALIDAEVAALAAGFSPRFVRPQNLVAYWPLIRDEDQDRVGGFDLTPVNGPTIAPHPPVIYPAPSSILIPSGPICDLVTVTVTKTVTVTVTETVVVQV